VFEATRYQVADNLNVMLEKHRLRFGFDFNLTPARQKRESNIQGRYDFASLADYRRAGSAAIARPSPPSTTATSSTTPASASSASTPRTGPRSGR
jgi:hypothetical protein